MKLFRWIWDNILFVAVLFLLIFIPLYPKLPLINVQHTWVYVRAEDFVIALVLLLWLFLLIRKKITLRTPLTMPILLFWIVGGIATIHGVLLIFPDLPNVFPNVAFLSYLRRVEYMSLFFVAFASIKDKRMLPAVITVLSITLFGVVFYGFGQKYLHFPAFLTMNEQFAKGIPIELSPLDRLPSTFAGHYDLAAWLVLVLPILASLIFGIRNFFVKIILSLGVVSGIWLLFMTVSRVSFVVLLVALISIVFFYKKKFVLFSLPFAAVIVLFLFTHSSHISSQLLNRFNSTVKDVEVLVNAKDGSAIGYIKEIKPKEAYSGKQVKRKTFNSVNDLDPRAIEQGSSMQATTSAHLSLPYAGVLYQPPNQSNGESLPQGTGYSNLTLSPVTRTLNQFFYELPENNSSASADVFLFTGKFLIKKAAAYDLSFTTRYQGEWPHAIEAFKRNVLVGSGYSSISLAVDNSYLRMIGETGSLGFISFLAIFVVIGMYLWKIYPHITSPLMKSFFIGYAVGVVGLAFNATLIDVFEASKDAYYLWMLTGITVGLLHLYQTKPINALESFKKVVTAPLAIIIYLGIFIVLLYFPLIDNFFVGDDFTWLRFAADCGNGLTSAAAHCASLPTQILHYFTQGDGVFYRPGLKTYFLLMYTAFWLNPTMYHIASLILHFLVSALVFLLARKIVKSFKLSVFAAFLFVTLSGYSESVFWISATGYLFTALFTLLAFYLFILWEEKKRAWLFGLTIVSLLFGVLFNESGVVAPLLILVYKFVHDETFIKRLKIQKNYYAALFVPALLYLFVRYLINNHWSGGDYNYNLVKLPFNFLGNFIGYLLLTLIGPESTKIYDVVRNVSRTHIIFGVIAVTLVIIAAIYVFPKIKNSLRSAERKIVFFSFSFMIVALLPFLGLGNIASRYSYLAAFGFVILFAFLVKKLYEYLLSNGRDIAFASITVIVSVFVLLQFIQVQQIQDDWNGAGVRVNNVLTSVQGIFDDRWLTQSIDLHLVNIPTQTGQAWVFPVGLDNALWFLDKNPKIHIYQDPSVAQAMQEVTNPANQRILLFNDEGIGTEKVKGRDNPTSSL